MSAPVSRMLAPVRFPFTVSAGEALSHFLSALVEGRILGTRCSECRKVYAPPRGVSPTCGIAANDWVTVSDRGTVAMFCIVNIPFEGQTIKPPYVYANILLDGSDIPLFHLVDTPVEKARMGMRVRAEWAPPAERKPTLETIRWFVPTGEPDAPYDSYKEHA